MASLYFPYGTYRPAEEQQGWMSYLGKALTTPASYLPAQVTDAFTQSRAFAQLKLPKPGLKSVCTVACLEGIHRILVVTSEGILYVGSIDPREGGECKIIKEHRLIHVGSGYQDDDEVVEHTEATGLVSQQPSYASVVTQGLSPPRHAHQQGSLDSHMTHPSDSPDQRPYNLASVEDEDEKPPTTQTVHS